MQTVNESAIEDYRGRAIRDKSDECIIRPFLCLTLHTHGSLKNSKKRK